MKEKIKVLITDGKPKKTMASFALEGYIAKNVPDMYDFMYANSEGDIIKSVDAHRPEIIFIYLPLVLQ